MIYTHFIRIRYSTDSMYVCMYACVYVPKLSTTSRLIIDLVKEITQFRWLMLHQ